MKFKWYLSNKKGWIKIYPGDRDWKFGVSSVSKPLKTKELQRIADILKKSR